MNEQRMIDANALDDALAQVQTSLESNEDQVWERNRGHHKGIATARAIVREAPAIDAVPVVHGRWLVDDLGHTHCSRCRERLPFMHCYTEEPCSDYDEEWDEEIPETKYCPHCGAKMDAKEEV